MYSSSIKAVNFDKVKNHYFTTLSSCDALLLNSSEIVFVEFKNDCLEYTKVANNPDKEEHRKCSNRNLRLELYLKISESVFILSHISDALFSDIRSKVSFILVYNDEKNPKTKIKTHIGNLG